MGGAPRARRARRREHHRGGERRGWERGRCIVFDDSYRHQVTHAGAADRLVFALQIENPEYTRVMLERYGEDGAWRARRSAAQDTRSGG